MMSKTFRSADGLQVTVLLSVHCFISCQWSSVCVCVCVVCRCVCVCVCVVLVGYQWFRFADCRLDTATSARMDVAFSVRCPVPFFHLDPLSQLLLDYPHGKQTTSATMHQVGISLFYIICVNI